MSSFACIPSVPSMIYIPLNVVGLSTEYMFDGISIIRDFVFNSSSIKLQCLQKGHFGVKCHQLVAYFDKN